MIAELTGLETGSIITGFVFGAIGLVIAGVSAFRQQDVKVEQPVSVTITEELHKVFASKDVFEKHVQENSKRHQQLFDGIEAAKEKASSSTEQKVEAVRRDLVTVGNQVAALKSTTDGQNAQLTRMEHTLSDLPSKIVADLVNAKKI